MTRTAAGLLLGVLGAAALACAFDPVGAWPLVLVGFAPILYAEHALMPPRWTGTSAAIGLGCYVGFLTWGALTWAQRPLLLLVPPLVWLGARADVVLQRRTGYRHLWWSGPVLWTAGLFLLGLTPISSWVDPAYALYRQAWLVQPVSVFTLSGANLAILLVNYLLVAILVSGQARQRAGAVAGLAVVLAGWTGLSVALDGHGRSADTVRVAAVQPGEVAHLDGLPLPERRAASDRSLLVLEEMTRQAAARGAQLVVWPEKALQDVDPAGPLAPRLRALARTTGAVIVIGYSVDPDRRNQAVLLEPDGRFSPVYEKQHPILFAGDRSIGGPVRVVRTPVGRIAPIICFDSDFTDTSRDAARAGARLLAVPSEDWSGIARQHYTRLVFRAVENRVAAVKADTAWDSAVIGPDGRIVAERVSTRAGRSLLVADVRLGTGRSVVTRVGNPLGWGCVLLAGVWAAIAWRVRRAGRGAP